MLLMVRKKILDRAKTGFYGDIEFSVNMRNGFPYDVKTFDDETITIKFKEINRVEPPKGMFRK